MALKDIFASASLEWNIAENLVLAPYVTVSQQLHGRLRDAARGYIEDEKHNSAYVLFGLALSAEF